MRDADQTLTYAELDALADSIAATLVALGVRAGDRVALWTEKSARVVAAMQGVLRVGAAYVPIDPLGPVLRARRIIDDCQVTCIVTDARKARLLEGDLTSAIAIVLVDDGPQTMAASDLAWRSWDDVTRLSPVEAPTAATPADGLAYILYTSGSTGVPKGVCISHRNAAAFVDDMVARLAVEPDDRLSNHAPFHFDLSVFDLYAAFRAGACVTVISETASYSPRQLVELVERHSISIWYSVPSALIQMMVHGRLATHPLPALRAILFAGEVFPIKHLAALRRAQPHVRLLNLYGPTETNVCAIHEVEGLDEDSGPIPIGRAASGDRLWAVTADGTEARVGEVGELMVEGPTVMLGYWGAPPQGRDYATGDLVQQQPDGAYLYLGRRDHMVKLRGYRIELGEIEAALSSHPAVHEAAVLLVGASLEAKLVACVVAAAGQPAPRLVSIKSHCAERVPAYMNVSEVRVVDALPRTSTGKVDRATLQEWYRSGRRGPERSL